MSETSIRSHKLSTSPMPSPFWKFLIKYIEQRTKTFCEKLVDRANQKPVDRSVCEPSVLWYMSPQYFGYWYSNFCVLVCFRELIICCTWEEERVCTEVSEPEFWCQVANEYPMSGIYTVDKNLQWKQARSQDFATSRGAFLRGGNNSTRTWPKFSSVLNQIEAVFLSKSGDLQKKRFSPKLRRFFRPKLGDLQKKKGPHFSWPTFGALQKKKTQLFWSK